MTGDVFEEDPLGGAFPDDPGNLGPEMAGIVGTTTFSGGAERLAGVTGEDDVEGASEAPCIETAEIIPDWRRGEISRALGRDEDGAGIDLPLDEGPSVETGFGQHEAQIKASTACAEGHSVPGT